MRWFAKMIFDGGGKRLKNYLKSICYTFNIFKNLKYFTKELARFLKPRNEEELSRGAILIEFAVCMPILIILLFYINDLVKLKRYYSQTEFVAQQIINMLQNVSKKRSIIATSSTEQRNLRRIALRDVWNINKLAYLTIYPPLTQTTSYPLGHYPYTHMYYVKKNDDGTVSCIWRCRYYLPNNNSVCALNNSHSYSSITWKTNAPPHQIHPSLKFGSENAKIIVETTIDNTIDQKKAFGLYLIGPRKIGGSQFHSVSIFTPKPGLFYEGVIKDSYTDNDF